MINRRSIYILFGLVMIMFSALACDSSTTVTTMPTNPPGTLIDPSIIATQKYFTDAMTQAGAGKPASTPAPIQASNVQAWSGTYYAQGQVNVRNCPQRNCTLLGYLEGGQAVEVNATVDGEAVKAGNTVWYRFDFNGLTGYAYADYLTSDTPTRAATVAQPYSVPPTQPFVVQPTLLIHQYACDGRDDLNCDDFSGADDAQAHLKACGRDEDNLDGNNNGLACEGTWDQ